MALTMLERSTKASNIIAAMRRAYEEHGDEGDFEDGYRYLRDDASDEELLAEEVRWFWSDVTLLDNGGI